MNKEIQKHHLAHESAWRPLQLIILALILLTFLASFAIAQSGGGATAFHQRPVGIEAIGFGGAYVALASDPSAIIWNPAGLSQSNKYRVLFTYSILQFDQTHNLVAFSAPIGSQLTIGGGWLNYSIEGFDRRDDNQQKLGEFGSTDNAFILSLSKSFLHTQRTSLSIGVNAKYLYSTIAGANASGAGMDFGAHFRYDRMSIGLAFQNLGSRIKWKIGNNLTNRIPFTFRIGTAYDFGFSTSRNSPSVKVTLEGAKTETRNSIFIAGMEGRMEMAAPRSSMALRVGYGNQLVSGGLTFGLMLDKNLHVDIQYAASEDFLSEVLQHHIGVALQF